METFLDSTSAPWVLAAGMVSVHAWFLTRPVIRLWRECEQDKKVLREEHAEMRAAILAMGDRLSSVENGDKT